MIFPLKSSLNKNMSIQKNRSPLLACTFVFIRACVCVCVCVMQALEVKYVFPLDEGAAVSKFEAQLEAETIKSLNSTVPTAPLTFLCEGALSRKKRRQNVNTRRLSANTNKSLSAITRPLQIVG